MKVVNQSNGNIIAAQCKVADNFFKRFKGLMGKSFLAPDHGLILINCNSIHMFFMRMPLDILFIDKSNKVVYSIENMRPWTLSKIIFSAQSVIELPVGTITKSSTSINDVLSLEPI